MNNPPSAFIEEKAHQRIFDVLKNVKDATAREIPKVPSEDHLTAAAASVAFLAQNGFFFIYFFLEKGD